MSAKKSSVRVAASAAVAALAFGMLLSGCGSKGGAKNGKGKTAESGQSSGDKNEEAPVDLSNVEVKDGGFKGNLPDGFEMPTDSIGKRMLREYGSMFVAQGVERPSKVIFADEAEVKKFHESAEISSASIGGTKIELQAAAMRALKKAVSDASSQGLSITPRGGSDAGRRNYAGTVTNWNDRVESGLDHWTKKGSITAEDAKRIRALSPFDQVPEIFKLEERKIFFAKDKSKSIIYSVSPPGASQHIAMLALDVAEFDNPQVRQILARNGWFQTVVSDLPHFTYLGALEPQLPKLGLRRVSNEGRTFWIPETD